MKKIFIALGMLAASMTASAQLADDDKQLFNHIGLGASVGTDGIGINLATTITPYMQLRAGVNFIPKIEINGLEAEIDYYEFDSNGKQGIINKAKEINNELNRLANNGYPEAEKHQLPTITEQQLPDDIEIGGKLNMFDYKVLLDLFPSKKSSFHLTVGFYAGKSKFLEAYNTNCHEAIQTIYNLNEAYEKIPADIKNQIPSQYQFQSINEINLGDDYSIELPKDGRITAYTKVNSFKPYVGIGSGRAISHKRRLSFSWDLGCQFWGTPKIYIQNKQITGEEAEEIGDVIKIVDQITVYPTFSLRLNGRIL